MRVLVLGGTGDANQLVAMLAQERACEVILSLAGRTSQPRLPQVPHRIGGFGGVDGLTSYIQCNNIDLVADVTHPFAAIMSGHAAEACARARIDLVRFERPEFASAAGDKWRNFASIEALAAALAGPPRRIFLSHGREGMALFARHPQHYYLVRSIEVPPDIDKLEQARLVLARGPFDLADEIALMREERIDTLVSKNSGGAATMAKIEAARQLGIEVLLLARPVKVAARSFAALDAMAAWILAHGRT
ncbi:MAG: cobalt-precorrin-6A reductase [Hyphomicrobiales bacterium]|nr:cobalt-precorrin-6A reductase [Hyphomicrobiales bacterium]